MDLKLRMVGCCRKLLSVLAGDPVGSTSVEAPPQPRSGGDLRSGKEEAQRGR